MKNLLGVTEIKLSHSEFVSDVIKKRWDVSKEKGLRFVDEYLSHKNNSKCFVAEYDGVPIGMGAFHINNDVEIDLHPWCIGLWVNPKHRGNGIGHKLTLKRFSWARKLGYKKIYLDTVNAEGYHKKFGWKNTGLMGWYDNSPTIIMEHNL